MLLILLDLHRRSFKLYADMCSILNVKSLMLLQSSLSKANDSSTTSTILYPNWCCTGYIIAFGINPDNKDLSLIALLREQN